MAEWRAAREIFKSQPIFIGHLVYPRISGRTLPDSPQELNGSKTEAISSRNCMTNQCVSCSFCSPPCRGRGERREARSLRKLQSHWASPMFCTPDQPPPHPALPGPQARWEVGVAWSCGDGASFMWLGGAGLPRAMRSCLAGSSAGSCGVGARLTNTSAATRRASITRRSAAGSRWPTARQCANCSAG